MKFTVEVYRDSLGDCTAFGISSKAKNLILVSAELPRKCTDIIHSKISKMPELFSGDETNSVKIIENVPGHFCAVPLIYPKGMIGPMFGGNFIYTSDGRFPFSYPIPIHDRFEVC